MKGATLQSASANIAGATVANPTGIEHRDARYQTAPDKYLLPADEEERIRLDTQYNILKKVWDGRLIQAPVKLNPGDRVLDSGAGTAIWSLDMAAEMPATTHIYAIDISARLFPLNPPPNVHTLTCSIAELPEDWTSMFKLIHQKLLFVGLSAEAWQTAFSEMHRVLISGGWVNLLECNFDVDRFDFTPGPHTRKMWEMLRELFRAHGRLDDAVYHLPGWLEKAGFAKISSELRKVPYNGDEGAAMRETMCSGLMAAKTAALQAGGMGFVKSEQEYDELVQAVREELAHTENAAWQAYMVTAQKPTV